MNFVLGSRGRLGRAIASSFNAEQVTALERAVYSEWSRNGASDDISRFFDSAAANNSVVYVAAGIIDPKALAEDHESINFRLPRNVIEGVTRAGLRVVTFGTVMEAIAGQNLANPYFASKAKLGEFVAEFSEVSTAVLHVRIHTLYGGGLPDRFMFLGQIFNAIINQDQFNMSSGTQLREYHHVDDDVAAIAVLLQAGAAGVVNLSHGDAITLRELAIYIFDEFGSSDLLNVGALPSPISDNYERIFEKEHMLKNAIFRDTLPSVTKYLQSCKAIIGEGK